ncbi:MAG: hypothetical protein WC119_02900 [Synergistaceae bacterium]
MTERKISECINVRINVGNYQHIELTKYAEESIEYSSAEERIKKEDELRDELVFSLIRSMKAIPEKLGKGIDAAIEVEESIKKAIPEWLENGAIPNIANGAEKNYIKNASDQKAQKDEASENLKEIAGDKLEDKASLSDDEDLFEEDEMPSSVKDDSVDESETTKPEEQESVEKETSKKAISSDDILSDLDDDADDDLFGNT